MAEVFESPLINVRSDHGRRRTHSINDPELDIAYESGNMAFDIPTSYEDADQQLREINRRKRWQLNYQEAAIFLQEGENNDKYYTHPHSHDALPAYEVAHNRWFYALDFVAALLVLGLAMCERPAVTYLSLPVGVHGSLELLGLLILSLDLGIRIKWLGWRTCLRHKRTVIKATTLLIMGIEAIVVLVRQTNHFRVTRALRPLFLIHSHYCRGVRRISRQVLQSMPPILDMIFLLLFFMLIFSILGFYLLSQIDNNSYFRTIQDSFVSLFILLTTANFPDVMMPAYATSPFYSLFFIVYLSLELYFLMNLLLAVVYDTFLNLEKVKIRSLFFHKREGCQHAFKLVTTKQNCSTLSVRHFVGMMRFFRPKRDTRDYYLMFKSLNTSKTGGITLEEFYRVYDICSLQWKLKNDDSLWSSNFRHPCNIVFKLLNRFVSWKWFDYFIYLVIACNFLWILIETINLSINAVNVKSYDFTASWTSIVFVCIYSVEAILKILGKGPHIYFTSGWDLFDFLVTVISVIGVLLEILDDSFYYIIVLRPFRLLRLFKIKRRYRDVLGTLFVLFSRLTSLAVVIIMVYYFFAIIGMEMFLNVDLKNCCKNSTMADYYSFDSKNQQGYYLNNFDNILRSGVTLFELTVVNNWFIIMEGYALGWSEWTRIYFMLFYIVMMVVMNIVVAFVLESFLFRINYRRTMDVDDIEDHGLYKVEMSMSEEERDMCERPHAWLTGAHIATTADQDGSQMPYVYGGERFRSKEDFSLRMYTDEVQTWIEEEKAKRREAICEMEQLRQRLSRPNSRNYADAVVDDLDFDQDTSTS
ncbi:two pore calcium channel protein 1-like isoform X1 [Haliotis rufescens]|uniref:two pore calcium channel protein 1-like isoform X1 n=3 Tax=Haliotis rufescens TaxID=6454 RepID=UPI001EB075CB|nr:two pore calcium channel protein 1-like isoform X1 [Haliotis rufescens]